MTSEEIKAIQQAHPELFAHLVAKGETEERAAQILTNHADAVQEEFDSLDDETSAALPSANDLREFVEAFEARYQRLLDHVNREIGVAQEVPLVARLQSLEARIAEFEKTKGGIDAQKEKAAKEESGAAEAAKPDTPA